MAGEIAALGGVHVAGGDDVVAAVHRLGEDNQQVTTCVGGAVDELYPFATCLGQAWSGVDGLFHFGGCHLMASPDVIFRLLAPTNLPHTHNIIQRITNGLWQGMADPFRVVLRSSPPSAFHARRPVGGSGCIALNPDAQQAASVKQLHRVQRAHRHSRSRGNSPGDCPSTFLILDHLDDARVPVEIDEALLLSDTGRGSRHGKATHNIRRQELACSAGTISAHT